MWLMAERLLVSQSLAVQLTTANSMTEGRSRGRGTAPHIHRGSVLLLL